ncbi:MAG: hypothetical protein RID53_24570 [Coleofasciculus sp. B1-GNL1-01]|uniref:hypothetical protein n=1 Tax=Coleofasciculus sp. B1-GNL1-01 TaxID=3068484 RepID=UPI0033043DE1
MARLGAGEDGEEINFSCVSSLLTGFQDFPGKARMRQITSETKTVSFVTKYFFITLELMTYYL